MSTTITREFYVSGVLTAPTSITLQDPTATFGVKRLDNDAVVVASGTAMTLVSTGVYTHTFDDPAYDLSYEYWVTIVYDGLTYEFEGSATGDTDPGNAATTYATIAEADAYMLTRLATDPWDDASSANQQKALAWATSLMDNLNFVGGRTDTDQELQFPRDYDDDYPQAIKDACSELALALLDGKDPEQEYENMRMITMGYANVRSTYDPLNQYEHIAAGIPSILAWTKLRPYLRDGKTIRLSRVS